jgi:hypothetical protein
MTRFLATLALVFAQALPWAGGPLFVCMEGDGGVCLDGGPLNCDCCGAETEADAAPVCHDKHVATTGVHDGSAHRGLEVNAAPCDCEHQLWEAAPTTLAGRVTAAQADHSAGVALALPAVVTPIVTAQSASADALVGPSAGATERLLACIVLRC